MTQSIILFLCILSTGLFIWRSYYKLGPRLTFNFFFFAFFIAALKEGPVRINGVLAKNPAMPYEFLSGNFQILQSSLLAIFGWVFTFYLGWYVAERIAERFFLKDRLFAVLLISGLVTASIGYAVESTAGGIGWWRWTIEDLRLAKFLAGAPLIGIIVWAHFPTQYLLAPYFLINLSKFKFSYYKGIFFIIPFIHLLAADFNPESARVGLELSALAILIILAFTARLRFDFSGIKLPVSPKRARLGWVEEYPLWAGLFLLATFLFLDLAKAHNPSLLASTLPFGLLLLFTVRLRPGYFIIPVVFCLILLKELSVPAVIPVAIIFLLAAFGRQAPSKGEK